MFKKLLKYDFKAIWKLWIICAASALGISIIGGISIKLLTDQSLSLPVLLQLVLGFWFFISVITLSAFLIATQILIYVRFYKHLFSDEGYLTFTLPVKRATLYISKTVNAVIWSILSGIVFIVAVLIMLFFATSSVYGNFFGVFAEIGSIFRDAHLGEILGVAIVIVDGILFALAATWFGVSLTQFCITVGATIARKHKILAAIGIYYAVNTVVGLITNIASLGLSLTVAPLLMSLSERNPVLFSLIAFAIPIVATAAFAGIALAFDAMTLKRLKYKLNMA